MSEWEWLRCGRLNELMHEYQRCKIKWKKKHTHVANLLYFFLSIHLIISCFCLFICETIHCLTEVGSGIDCVYWWIVDTHSPNFRSWFFISHEKVLYIYLYISHSYKMLVSRAYVVVCVWFAGGEGDGETLQQQQYCRKTNTVYTARIWLFAENPLVVTILACA